MVVYGKLGEMLVCMYPKFLKLSLIPNEMYSYISVFIYYFMIMKMAQVSSAFEGYGRGIFSLCWEEKKCLQKPGSLVLVPFLLSRIIKTQKIIELSTFSLFIKPGLLTLKRHSDRGAKRKKGLQEKNRKGEKDLGRVSVLGCSRF